MPVKKESQHRYVGWYSRSVLKFVFAKAQCQIIFKPSKNQASNCILFLLHAKAVPPVCPMTRIALAFAKDP